MDNPLHTQEQKKQRDFTPRASCHHSGAAQSEPSLRAPAASAGWLRRIVMKRLRNLREGRLTIIDESGAATTVGRPSPGVVDACIRIRRPEFFRQIVVGGSLGAAESYLQGHWETDNLVALIRLFARNYEAADSLNGWSAAITQKMAQCGYWLKRNTRKGSRKNIAAHYDLGNDFYQLFLDSTMTYSSAVFEPLGESEKLIGLRDAQLEKYDRICRKLQLTEDDRVIEVGCGWGGFAIHAATNYGCHVTATTISDQQFEYAQQQIERLGLSRRIDLIRTDYRDLGGTYDKLVSIEMIEAVGYENLNTYFGKCSSLLKPNGMMVIQAITIPDQRFASYRRSVDFIQQYVFPGGFLPSPGAIQDSLRDATDLRVVHVEDFAQHYAETLARWSDRFESNINKVRELSCLSTHDIDRFIRLWRYYLAYCEAGFLQRMIGLSQWTFAKPDCRSDTNVPRAAASF